MLDKAAFNTEEVRKILHLGRSTIYEALRAGAIPSLRIGRKYLIPAKALERMLEQAGAEMAGEDK